MTLPKITIGLACYNAEATIGRAVESALAQNWPDLDVVVVDDVSSDGSVAIVQSLAQRDPRVRLTQHSENTGPGGVRATILAQAQGDFIAFFDDDDESDPDRVVRQYERIVSYEAQTGAALIACYASGQRLYPNGYTVTIDAIGSQPAVPVGEAVADYLLFYGKWPGVFYGAGVPTCALMARRAVFEAVGGFNATFRRVEDVEFAVRLARAGGHFIGCAERLYTQYATQSSDKSAEKNYEAERRLLELNKDYLQSKKRYRYARNWFRFRYNHFAKRPVHALASFLVAWVSNPIFVSRHFMDTGLKRIGHEKRMRRSRGDVT